MHLKNKNFRRNWKQRLQKRFIFFPKFRYFQLKKLGSRFTTFHFGNSVFTIPKPVFFTHIFLSRFDLNLKRVVRKKDKTLRRYWITTRVLFNLTRQSKGARMGKGKGRNFKTFQLINAFTSFIEFRGVRLGRLRYFLHLFNSRFTVPLFLINHWTTTVLNSKFSLFRNA